MVAGAGIVGTWHALELVRAGFTVDHLEADAAPTGASVRNFGLVWVSGRRSGEELDVALRARRRWEEVGAAVPGLGFRPAGSLTVACTAAEREVMQAFARHPDAAARSITFLEPEELRACNPARAVATWRARCTVRSTRWSSRGSPWARCGTHLAQDRPGPLPLPSGAPGGRGRGADGGRHDRHAVGR